MLKKINKNLIDKIYKKKNPKTKNFFSLNNKIAGESFKSKINKIRNILKSNKADYLLVSAPENVAWTLNIRGSDNPNSPIPNCRLIIGKNKELFLIAKKIKVLKNRLKSQKPKLIYQFWLEKILHKAQRKKI